jgi:threonine aldolase
MLFGSDNQTGASEQVLDMIRTANEGHTRGYGNDEWTKKAVDRLRDVFVCDLDAFFVSTGTASNCLGLSCLVQPWELVLCHSLAHIFVDESTAPELFTGGARMVPISNGAGKIGPEHLKAHFATAGTDTPHNPIAKALSIAQASEAGLVYTPLELEALCGAAKHYGLKVHMDGARFANAVASCACSPAELSWKAGVDVLSLGATKCGALLAEAIVIFDKGLAGNFSQMRKRTGHLLSKGRVFGSQFVGWLKDDHWLDLARHANHQATQLAESLSAIDGVRIVWPVQANELFVTMPKDLCDFLRSNGAVLHEWYTDALPIDIALDPSDTFVRLVTSFATTDLHREDFIEWMRTHHRR